MTSNATGILASERGNDANKALAQIALQNMAEEECLGIYQLALSEAIGDNKDEMVTNILDLIEGWHLRNAEVPAELEGYKRENEQERIADANMLAYLRDLYPTLPTYEQGDVLHREYSAEERMYEAVYVLPKTKKHILSYIASKWMPRSRSEDCVGTFRYLIEMYTRDPGLSWLKTGNKWRIEHSLQKEQKMILEVFADRCNDTFRSKDEVNGLDPFYFWMCQDKVPEEFLEVLAKKRAREGKVKLAIRDGSYAEILKHLGVESRSEEAIRFAKCVLERVAGFDLAVEVLHDMMQPWVGIAHNWRETGVGVLGGNKHQEIGASEVVVGDITFTMRNFESLVVLVTLPENSSKELASDVYGRARRHILKWREDHECEVLLNVCIAGVSETDFLKVEEFD